MSNLRFPSPRFGWLALVLCVGCATSPRNEKTNSAAPPPPALAPQEAAAREAPADKSATGAPAAASLSAEAEAAQSPPTFAPAPAKPTSEQPTMRKKAASPAPAAAPKGATARAETGGSRDLLQEPLQPIAADPPQLRTALEELLTAAEELSAGNTCEHGCKAFQSMQRAALRICDLTPANDPLHRCTSARSRVSEASQELKKRCGNCQ